MQRREAALAESSLAALHKTGQELFQLVFTGKVRHAFDEGMAEARRLEHWFHLRLTFEAAPIAAEWPWEALVDSSGTVLALQPRVSIERIPTLSRPTPPPRIPRDRKIRLLVAGASPPDLSRISVRPEKTRIRAAFSQAGAEIKVTERTSRASLDKVLSGKAAYDLIHLIGHGDFDGKEGGLWLEGETGKGSRLTSRELPAFLRRPVPFVFLNVCHSGRSSGAPFTGFAEALLRWGVAGVLAMRRPITDQGAVELAQAFYGHVAQGESVAHALAMARREVRVDDGDWAVPVLFLADADFVLLPRRVEEALPPRDRDARPLPFQVPRPFAALGMKTSVFGEQRKWIGLAFLIGIVLLVLLRWPSPSLEPGEIEDRPSVEPKAPLAPRSLVADPRCPSPKGLELDFVFIPAGSFIQGSDRVPKDERPPHPVRLTQDFCIGAFEVTRAQYAAVLEEDPPKPAEALLPQARVSWDQVQDFLQILNLREPEAGYRLATEAEWEYAARAGTTTYYSFGDDASELGRYANCLSREGNGDSYDIPAPVGTFEANAWGLYDMQGNVWEWVEDSWSEYAPDALEDPRGPGASERKVRRGGSYRSATGNCRPTTRADSASDRNQADLGFRLVRTSVP